MGSIITTVGEQLFAQKAQANQQLDIDTFIFANVIGQDESDPISRTEIIPTANIVHQQAVEQSGKINSNVVVYSAVLGSTTGTFDFNWVGLYSSVNDTLVAINHLPTTTKTATVPGEAGNTLNRNFGIEYSGISDLVGITVAPETWQLDFTARLSGMDLLTQQLATDMNGENWFINDGFKVVQGATNNDFNVSVGVGYVKGLRIEQDDIHGFTVASYPKFVYVDAYFDGDASSTWKPKQNFSVTNTELNDYVDSNGIQHYVIKIALINDDTDIEDLRPVGALSNKIEKQKNATALVIPDVDITGSTDETLKVIELLNLGYSVKLPAGKVKLNITIPDGAVLIGSGAPRFDTTVAGDWDNFGTVVVGEINVSNKQSWAIGNLSIDSFDGGGNSISGIGARTGYGFVNNVKTRANNHGQLYETACTNALAGLSKGSGVVGNIVAQDCEHWGGPNGFVTKHHKISFIRCVSHDVSVQSFVAVSDNINNADIYNRATDSVFEGCVSYGQGLFAGGAEGVRIYTQDRFSADPANDVNTNGVQPVDNTRINNYKYFNLAGYPIRVGDYNNTSVASIASINTKIEGLKYQLNAFGAVLLLHSAATIISNSFFGAGNNVGVSDKASSVIIEDNNVYSGGNVQTGAETGKIIVNDNSNVIENRFWTEGLTYLFRNTQNTLVNQVDYSIYNRPVRFVIEDTFTEINIFSSDVAYKGKGTIIDCMFNGAEWVVLSYGTTKTVNEQEVGYSNDINFNFVDANSINLSVNMTGDLTAIDATVSGMPMGSTVAINFNAGSSSRVLSGWSSLWRFIGSSTSANLGNPPTTLAAYTKLYMEFYVTNGILIEKYRSEYA